jgi:hypothetical protein
MSTSLTPIAVDFRKVSSTLGSGDGSLIEQLLLKYRDELEEVDELADELEEDEDDSDDEEDDEDSRLASLRALSQSLGQAKQGLEGDQSVGDVLKGLGQAVGVSAQHKKALQDFFDDSDDEDEDEESSDEEFASAADVLRHLITGEKPARRVAHRFKYGFALQYLCQHLGDELPRGDGWLELQSKWARMLDQAMKSVGIPAKTLSVAKHLAKRGSPFEAVPKYSDAPEIGFLKRDEIERALAALSGASFEGVGAEEQIFLADIRGWLQTCAESKRDLICFGR